MDYIKERNPLKTNFKGKIEQGGVGYYSLCRACNNFLGSNYVTEYQKYSNSFIDLAKKKDLNAFEIIMHDFQALKVFKQIVSMFFSINELKFSENNRDLAAFVLNPDSNDFPSRFRVFNYLNTEGDLRNIGLMATGSLMTGNMVLGSELAFPPLGHVLTVNFDGNLPYHQEITAFKDFKLEEAITFEFRIYRLPTHMPFLLDYRDRGTIENAISNSP